MMSWPDLLKTTASPCCAAVVCRSATMLSTDDSTALSVSTCITRWLPPLRSRPSEILGTLLRHNSGSSADNGVDGRNKNSAINDRKGDERQSPLNTLLHDTCLLIMQ